MSDVLIVGEIKNGELKKISRELSSAGKKLAGELGGKVTALIIGNGGEKYTDDLKNAGADKIINIKTDNFSAEGYANIVSTIVNEKKPAVVLIPHTAEGRDYSPRVAVKIGAGIIADVVELKVNSGKVLAKKPIYSGKAFGLFKVSTPIQMFTVRPNSQEITNTAGAGEVESSSAGMGEVKVKQTKLDASAGSKVQLSEASIIVSGGRGIKGPENWPILQKLADVLGAALGASRATVDAGWISHTHQVGQTGKTVSPNCYIACGISGAIQHLAGMGSSKYIVAINKDPDAPIFKVATYGIVGDLFEIVPAVTDEFKKVLG